MASSGDGSELSAEAMLACTTPGRIRLPPRRSGAAPVLWMPRRAALSVGVSGMALAASPPAPPDPPAAAAS